MSTRTSAPRGAAGRGLGRGLAALIPDGVFDESLPAGQAPGGPLQQVPIDRVRPNPEQPRMRFSAGALEQLAESIRNHGVLTPILVRRDADGQGYVLIAGERRLRAAGLAGLETVPAWVRDDVSDREQLEIALVENLQREDLDPIETAEAYKRLIDEFGLTQAEVARKVGKDRATVANAVRLLKLPEFALAELRRGRISAGHAKALLAAPDDAMLRVVLREVLRNDLSVRATERLVARLQRPPKPRNEAVRQAIAHLADRLTRAVGSRVRVEQKGRSRKGRVIIEYSGEDELQRIVARLEGA